MEIRVGNKAIAMRPPMDLEAMKTYMKAAKAGDALGKDHLSLSGSTTQQFFVVSDGHSTLNEFPRFVTALDQARATNPDGIFLYNGDAIVGTPYYPVGNNGVADMKAIESLHPDSFVIGNHDVDPLDVTDPESGPTHLAQLLAGTDFPVTIANWTLAPGSPLAQLKAPDGSPRIKPYQVVERNGHKVAIVGLSVDPAQYGYTGTEIQYQDPAQTLEQLIPQIKQQYGQDTMIVAQTHIGSKADEQMATNPAFSDVVFFAAHDHIPMAKPQVDAGAKGDSGVTDTGAYYRNLGVFSISEDPKGEVTSLSGGLVPTSTLTPDASTVAAQAPLEAQVTAQYRQPIAQAPAAITRAKLPGTGDSVLGNLVSDQMLHAGNAYLAAQGDDPADFAIFNDTGLRTDIPAGTITKETLYDVIPFDDQIGITHLTGAQVQQVLDNSAARQGDPVSGVQDTISSAGASNININGLPLDPGRTYTVVTTGYLMDQGGSGYQVMQQGTDPLHTGLSLRDTLTSTVELAKVLQANPGPVRQATGQ